MFVDGLNRPQRQQNISFLRQGEQKAGLRGAVRTRHITEDREAALKVLICNVTFFNNVFAFFIGVSTKLFDSR